MNKKKALKEFMKKKYLTSNINQLDDKEYAELTMGLTGSGLNLKDKDAYQDGKQKLNWYKQMK